MIFFRATKTRSLQSQAMTISQSLSESMLWQMLAAILLYRLVTLGLYPLLDTSEARYGEMARKMLELNDWITPYIDYQVPFWGKPPLSFWSQAASMKLFGVNEFAARLPAWLFHVASCLLIIRFGDLQDSRKVGLFAAIIFSSTALGVVSSGVVLTDPALSFSLLLAYYGFWRACTENSKRFAYFGFIGLALGLLAKGPLVLVLFALPAIIWTVYQRQWRALFRLPWLKGCLLMLAIALPWYVLAEMKTPGFLQYFFIGEHWDRYMVSGWQGDLYGSAHSRAHGMIWLDLLLALFPWSLLLPLLIKRGKPSSSWRSFLFCWALATPLFFTLSGNILWTYVLPALPAWSLLLADQLYRSRRLPRHTVTVMALSLPVMTSVLLLNGGLFDSFKNQSDVISEWRLQQQDEKAPLYYLSKRPFSADFYSRGRSLLAENVAQLPQQTSFYLALRDRGLGHLDSTLEQGCEMKSEMNKTRLLYCSRPLDTVIKLVSNE